MMPGRKKTPGYREKRGRNENKNAIYKYPSLHQKVLDAVGGVIDPAPWYNESGDGFVEEEYNTNIMGRFCCSNESWYGIHTAF